MAAQIPSSRPGGQRAAIERSGRISCARSARAHGRGWHTRARAGRGAGVRRRDARPNQLHVARDDVRVTAADLLAVPEGEITEDGLRTNVDVAFNTSNRGCAASGCVPIYNLMEDAATAEISRRKYGSGPPRRAPLQRARGDARLWSNRSSRRRAASSASPPSCSAN